MANVFDQFDSANVFDRFDGVQPVPSSGLTVAPKGGVVREGTLDEAEGARISQAGFGSLALEAASNVPSSAVQFVKDVAQPFVDPVGTVKAVGGLVGGGVQKLIPGEQGQEPQFDAVVDFFKERYGGVENLKRTVTKDPVGFLGDLALVVSGGAGVAVRAPGAIGKAASVAGKAGRAIDPVTQAIQAGKAVGRGVGNVTSGALGLSTGVGGRPITTAARAGFVGGEVAKAFADNLRGNVPMTKVVETAKNAVSTLREVRGNAYRAGMSNIAQDAAVLDFKPVTDALAKTNKVKRFKGKDISPSTKDVRTKLATVVDEWKKSDPADFHTAAGFDALKQTLDDIRQSTQRGTPERLVADQVVNSVKDQIVKQAPDYAKVMNDYGQASVLIKEMERALSVNDKASVDTTLRKLQSVMRDNVSTNYGQRVALVEVLKQHGAKNLLEELAGQALSSGTARGIARVLPQIGAAAGGGGLAASLAGLMSPGLAISVLGSLALQSPRLIGEAALAAGRAGRVGSKVPARAVGQAAFQSRALGEEQPLR